MSGRYLIFRVVGIFLWLLCHDYWSCCRCLALLHVWTFDPVSCLASATVTTKSLARPTNGGQWYLCIGTSVSVETRNVQFGLSRGLVHMVLALSNVVLSHALNSVDLPCANSKWLRIVYVGSPHVTAGG